MTTTRNQTTREQLTLWWTSIKADYPLILRLVEEGLTLAEHDFDGALNYVEAVRRHLSQQTIDTATSDAHKTLLTILNHLIAALRYAINDDRFQRHTRSEMASAALDGLRLYLLQQNVVA